MISDRQLIDPHEAEAERGERRLEANHAERRRIELQLLVLQRVRRVVRRDAVDGAGRERRAQRVDVGWSRSGGRTLGGVGCSRRRR